MADLSADESAVRLVDTMVEWKVAQKDAGLAELKAVHSAWMMAAKKVGQTVGSSVV